MNFFSSIFKSKNKPFFDALFNKKNKEKGGIWLLVPVFIIGSLALTGADVIYSWITGTPDALWNAIVLGIADLILSASMAIADLTSNIFSSIIANVLNQKITTDPIFLDGWASVRDLANMLIVLGFVVVGIAFTLRLEGYGTKKVLLSLILIALLINFSPVICGLIIDGSNILYTSLDSNISGDVGNSITFNIEVAAFGKSIIRPNEPQEEVPGALTKVLRNSNALEYAAKEILFSLLYILVIFTFFYLSFIFVERYIYLSILFVLSPLAFFCLVFPATKKYWTMWWENII